MFAELSSVESAGSEGSSLMIEKIENLANEVRSDEESRVATNELRMNCE
jgi:hypothetical protein